MGIIYENMKTNKIFSLDPPSPLNLSTMVGENFEIQCSQTQTAQNAFNLSTMVGKNVEIYLSQMAKNALKLSIMVGENKTKF